MTRTPINPPTADETQEVRGNMRGDKGGFFGNEADSHEHRSPGTVHVGQALGGVGAKPAGATHAAGEAIPPDAGARGRIDQRTGEVRGSGAGAGGGQPGEDFDADDAGGSGAGEGR